MKKSLIFSFSLIGQIGFATAIPLVIFGLIGRYLDKQFSTAPWLFLFGLMLATLQIYFYLRSIVRKASESVKKL
ncbi:MAG: putative F0F1-ATPase [bacterium ADurb.Bin212]|jgi:F0F1-type ATP synthase assembly protein I|nr:MAG: putative F0F1-ATPase [bacterium ADurb.Bin212]